MVNKSAFDKTIVPKLFGHVRLIVIGIVICTHII